MSKRLLITAVILLAVFSISAAAQETPTAPPQGQLDKPQEISPEKQALVKEFLEALDFKRTAEGIINGMFAEFDRQRPELIWQSLSTMKEMERLTATEREFLRAQIADRSALASKRFRERLAERIDFGQMVEEIATELYAKYFSESELRDLITFYKSSTGKRTLEVMPNLMVESMAKTGEKLRPVFKELMSEVSKDETKEFQTKVTELVKSHHKTSTPSNKSRRLKDQ